MAHHDPFPGAPAAAATVYLASLDQTTVRALCDAGYVTAGAYVDLAAANGWLRPTTPATPPMAQQPPRAFPVTSFA